jgi:hypothetical protein
LRTALASYGRIGSVDLGPLADGRGMFAMLSLSAAEIDVLQSEFGIYMSHTGRINIAGLAEDRMDYFVDALRAAQCWSMNRDSAARRALAPSAGRNAIDSCRSCPDNTEIHEDSRSI